MNYNIYDAGGFWNFLRYVQRTKPLPYFKEKEEGVLVPISFTEFEALSDAEKQKIYEKLGKVISQIQEAWVTPFEDFVRLSDIEKE